MPENTMVVIEPNEPFDQWAIVNLNGHNQTAGRVTAGPFGLMRLDVPMGANKFYTKLFNPSSVYDMDIVSEEIARAHAPDLKAMGEYDAPVVDRDKYKRLEQQARERERILEAEIKQLRDKLLKIDQSNDVGQGDVSF